MTVFISRTLKANSPILFWAETKGQRLITKSFLTFKPVAYAPPPDADWWFFYSPRAVEFALHGGILPPQEAKLAAIGGGTAQYLNDALGRVDFSGDGNPERTAEAFLKVSAGERVFFPRAKQSRLSVQKALQDKITVLDAVCYDNVLAPAAAPINADVYIFTSPLNVAAYVDHQPLPPNAKVIAMGPSTGAVLQARGIECEWPHEASEEAIVLMLDGMQRR
jgi:uroporphyrinogen-III synthase